MWNPLFGESESVRRRREHDDRMNLIRSQDELNRVLIAEAKRRALQEKEDRKRAYYASPEGQAELQWNREYNKNLMRALYNIWIRRVVELPVFLYNYELQKNVRVGHIFSYLAWLLVIIGILVLITTPDDKITFVVLSMGTVLVTFVYSAVMAMLRTDGII